MLNKIVRELKTPQIVAKKRLLCGVKVREGHSSRREGRRVELWAWLAAVLLLALPRVAKSQDRLEIGILGGTSYYLGDMNPRKQFHDCRLAAGGLVRYCISDRMSVKGVVSYNGIKGSYSGRLNDDRYRAVNGVIYDVEGPNGETEGYQEVVPGDLSFSNGLIDVSFSYEVNWQSFDHFFRKEQSKFTPYACLGLGVTCYRSWEKGDRKRRFTLSIPVGLGVKWKATKFMRIGCEWTFHKTFTDCLDTVKDHQGSFSPRDPYGNKVHSITHNNDWFSALAVQVTFSMWPRKLMCNDGMRSFNK